MSCPTLCLAISILYWSIPEAFSIAINPIERLNDNVVLVEILLQFVSLCRDAALLLSHEIEPFEPDLNKSFLFDQLVFNTEFHITIFLNPHVSIELWKGGGYCKMDFVWRPPTLVAYDFCLPPKAWIHSLHQELLIFNSEKGTQTNNLTQVVESSDDRLLCCLVLLHVWKHQTLTKVHPRIIGTRCVGFLLENIFQVFLFIQPTTSTYHKILQLQDMYKM